MSDVNRYIKDLTRGSSPHAVLGGLLALGTFNLPPRVVPRCEMGLLPSIAGGPRSLLSPPLSLEQWGSDFEAALTSRPLLTHELDRH